MTLRLADSPPDAFTRVATWYFANPPSTWCVVRHPEGWLVTAADGTYISAHSTKRDAAANLTDGPDAARHYAMLDWYLGYSRDSGACPPTDAEREIVERIVSKLSR